MNVRYFRNWQDLVSWYVSKAMATPASSSPVAVASLQDLPGKALETLQPAGNIHELFNRAELA